jgi:hypothetical protein
VQHDRARFEDGQIALLISRNLAEWMQGQVSGLFQRAERNEANLVGLSGFFERPANARVACQSFAAIGRPFDCGW